MRAGSIHLWMKIRITRYQVFSQLTIQTRSQLSKSMTGRLCKIWLTLTYWRKIHSKKLRKQAKKSETSELVKVCLFQMTIAWMIYSITAEVLPGTSIRGRPPEQNQETCNKFLWVHSNNLKKRMEYSQKHPRNKRIESGKHRRTVSYWRGNYSE